jgi:hypothetical protein
MLCRKSLPCVNNRDSVLVLLYGQDIANRIYHSLNYNMDSGDSI